MTANQKNKAACFTLEGLNSFSTILYFNYFYFFLHDKFGFDDKRRLAVAALLGLIYTFVSWQAGKFAQRRGNFAALKLGFGLMLAGLAVGSQLDSALGQIVAANVVSLGMCFTWPVLEALISEGETTEGLPRAVGLYNITWAATNAAAYFIGGTIIQAFGYHSIFYVPIVILIVQLALTRWLQNHTQANAAHAAGKHAVPPPDPHRPSPAKARSFQRMAWLANPFAYIAINTLIAVLPGVAAKFQLSPMLAGFACSLWCFARLFAFIALWQWTGWHYKFRWLVTAFALLIVSFAAILMVPSMPVMLLAQVFFGIAIGLIYYSSLFYAMDASDTKSEHGGIHEAAIGAGNCLGPATGAAALWLAPQTAGIGAWAVSAMLMTGLGGLIWLRKMAK